MTSESANDPVPLLFKSFYLNSAARLYGELLSKAGSEGWTHQRFLRELLTGEHQDLLGCHEGLLGWGADEG